MVSGQPNTMMKELLKKTPKLKLGSLQCTSHLSADKGEILIIIVKLQVLATTTTTTELQKIHHL